GFRVRLGRFRLALLAVAVVRPRRLREPLVALVPGRVRRGFALRVRGLPLAGIAGLALVARPGLPARSVLRIAGLGRAALGVGLVAGLALLAALLLPRRRLLRRRLLLLEHLLE